MLLKSGSSRSRTLAVLGCLLVNSVPMVWDSLVVGWIIFWCPVTGGRLPSDRSCLVVGDSWISPVFRLSKSNDRWLDGQCPVIRRLEVSILSTWPVVGECPETGGRWPGMPSGRWPGMPSRSDMSSCLLGKWPVVAIDHTCPVDGQSVVGCPVTVGHLLVDLYSLGYKYPGSCHLYGSYPWQQGHKGQCSHIFFSFHLMKQTHLEPSFCSTWLSFWKNKFFSFLQVPRRN